MGRDMRTVRLVAPRRSPHTHTWMGAFRSRGWEPELVSLTTDGRAVSWWLLPWRALSARFSPRPAVTVFQSMGAHGLLGALLPRSRRSVVVPWGSEVQAARRSRWRSWIGGFILRRADVALVTSHDMAETLRTLWSASAPEIIVISWGVSEAALRRHDHAAARHAVELATTADHGATVVLAPRGVGSVYRHHVVLEAFRRARRTRRDLHLIVIDTRGTDVTDYESTDTDGVTILPMQPRSEFHTLLAGVDCVVSIPAADQRSTAVLEAIAIGARVLLSDIAVYRELLVDGADVDILGEPVLEALTLAFRSLKPMPPAAREANQLWARTHERESIQFDQIVMACTKGVR